MGSIENEHDILINDTLGKFSITGRSFVIYQWQVILSHCNKFYDNFVMKDFSEVKIYIDEINKQLIDKSFNIRSYREW